MTDRMPVLSAYDIEHAIARLRAHGAVYRSVQLLMLADRASVSLAEGRRVVRELIQRGRGVNVADEIIGRWIQETALITESFYFASAVERVHGRLHFNTLMAQYEP